MRVVVAGKLVLAALLLVSPLAAAQGTSALLVDVEWLSQHLTDRDLVVLHVGDKPGYDIGHIPGARFINDGDVTTQRQHDGATLMYELPPAADLRAKLATLGISDDSRIVVSVGSAGNFPSATRVVFTLDYLGLGERTSLLNGGMVAWKGAGKPVTAALPAVTAGKLSERPTRNVLAEAEFVRSIGQRANHTLVDARAAVFYKGIEQDGHIPGAVNIPFTQITDNQQLIQRERIVELFKSAGVKPGDTVVAYCHIGQQATAVIFAARLLGHPVMLYDGSFTDWSRNKRGAVEK